MMISITGYVFVNDMDSGRKFGTKENLVKLEIKNVVGTYIMFLTNFVNISNSRYLLKNLDNAASNKKEEIVLTFSKPNHEVLVISDDDQVKNFIEALKSFCQNVVARESFLTKVLGSLNLILNCNIINTFDANFLRIVALENCNLPYLPEGIGHLTLASFSLNYSRINMSKNGQDLFWDWMTKHNISISLTVLKMKSIGLNKLPFEIIHLKRLQTLQVSCNKLTFIPHFIGELPELVYLKVHDNLLSYLPENVFVNILEDSAIQRNRFPTFSFNKKLRENVEFTRIRNAPKLLDLSVLCLIKNDVKFKRLEIPRPLWNSYDLVRRCKICNKLFVFDKKYQKFHFSKPKPRHVTRLKINWQFFECSECTHTL